jgi:phosphomannomutase/phosphoglucomutase
MKRRKKGTDVESEAFRDIFKEYDIRGIAHKEVTGNTALLVGKAFGTYASKKGFKKIVVGRDNRISSKSLSKQLVKGIVSTGCDVEYIGMLPTPAFYFSLQLQKTSGVMVTASHNPANYNGFKLCIGTQSIYGSKIQEVRKIIEKGIFKKGRGQISKKEIVKKYAERIESTEKTNRKIKVVVDAGNGVGGVAGEILKKMGCEVVELYCNPDGRYPHHHPDPSVEENMKDISKKVVETHSSVGVAFDVDADRMGCVDENGKILRGDELLAIFAEDALKQKKGYVVFDVKTSRMVGEVVKKNHGKPFMWKTGHSLTEEKSRELNAVIAGEVSGHFYFYDRYYGFDDGIYAACRVVEILSKTTKKLSQLVKELPRYHSTPELRIECEEKEKFKIVKEMVVEFKKKYKVVTLDGGRVEFKNGWGLIRASNTQPMIVVRVEGKTENEKQRIIKIFNSELEKRGIKI